MDIHKPKGNFIPVDPTIERFNELNDRDKDIWLVGTVDPETLETSFTPDSEQLVANYLSSPAHLQDWEALAESIDTRSPSGIGLLDKTMLTISEIELLKAKLHRDPVRIAELEQGMYGHMYSDRLFTHAVHRTLDFAKEFNPDEYPYAHKLGQQITPILEEIAGNHEKDHSIVTSLNPEAKHAYAEWLQERLGHIFEGINPNKEYDAASLTSELQRALDLLPEFSGTQWRAEVSEKSNTVTVHALDQLVAVSPAMRPVSGEKVIRLIIHEVFVHARRSAVGAQNDSALGSQGTAEYSEIEESLAILLEGSPFPDARRGLPGVNNYLSTSLALGKLNADLNRSEIHSLARSIWHMTSAAVQGKDLTLSDIERRKISDLSIVKSVFHGIPLEAKGVAQMSYLKYLYGLERAASLLNTMAVTGDVDANMDWALSGKFHPLNRNDRAIIGEYHPMPSTLEPVISHLEQTR